MEEGQDSKKCILYI